MRRTIAGIALYYMYLSLFPAPAAAQEWFPIDARTKATGGAGVAFGEGPSAAYWNPASLADGAEMPFDFTTGFGMEISAGADVNLLGSLAVDIVNLGNLYSDIEIDDIRDEIDMGTHTEADVQDAFTLVDAILDLDNPDGTVLITAGAGVDLKIGPFSIFTRGFGGVGLDPFMDPSGANGQLTTSNLDTFFSPLTSAPGTVNTVVAFNTSTASLGESITCTPPSSKVMTASAGSGASRSDGNSTTSRGMGGLPQRQA